MDDEVITEIHRDYIYNLTKKGERVDGRSFSEYRDISIETNIISRAEGSARVKIGDTQVIVGVKIQPGEPYPDSPNKGVIITNVELVPLASPEFEPGPPNENAVELARVVDRGIRESGAVDLSKLCIEDGKKVWILFIDVHIIDDNGNLVDASALGAIAALRTAHIPKKQYNMGDEDEALPVNDAPVAITAIEFEGEIMYDPGLYEGKVASVKLTVISNAEGALSGMQKSGDGPLTEEQINSIVTTAIEKAKGIREKYLEI